MDLGLRASIVIPVWNAADVTDTCLRLVLATIRQDDEVIVVDNGSNDHTPDVLARFADLVTVITHVENKGFAAGCNAGADVASGDIVVYLNNDTLPVGTWLDDLLAPFSDPAIGATGPLSNVVSGPQLHRDPTYAPSGIQDVERQTARIRARHGSDVVRTSRLVGFCLAVRREIIVRLGGFDTCFGIGSYEDDDLCRRITAAGHDLVVVRGAFVHHIGHQTFAANGLDWVAVELENKVVMADKLAAARPLSFIVLCGDDRDAILATVVDVVDLCTGNPDWIAELVLVVTDLDAAAPVLEGLGGQVTAVAGTLDETASLQIGLAAADGLRRAVVSAGDHVDRRALTDLLRSDARSVRPTRVGIPVLSATTSGAVS